MPQSNVIKKGDTVQTDDGRTGVVQSIWHMFGQTALTLDTGDCVNGDRCKVIPPATATEKTDEEKEHKITWREFI